MRELAGLFFLLKSQNYRKMQLVRLRFIMPWIVGVLVIFAGIFVARWIGFYFWFENADTLMHTIGGIVAAWIAASLLNGHLATLPRWKRGAVIISVAVTIVVAWELAEYGVALARDSLPSVYPYFHGGDLPDTLLIPKRYSHYLFFL